MIHFVWVETPDGSYFHVPKASLEKQTNTGRHNPCHAHTIAHKPQSTKHYCCLWYTQLLTVHGYLYKFSSSSHLRNISMYVYFCQRSQMMPETITKLYIPGSQQINCIQCSLPIMRFTFCDLALFLQFCMHLKKKKILHSALYSAS